MGQSGTTENCEKIVWPIDSFDSVIEAILKCKKAEFTPQIKYLFGYMKRRGALSIIIEKEYTDGDYLSDYANYYCRCHDDYPRKTTRLHFFEHELDDEKFESILLEDDSAEREKLSKAYLGFTVIKPLPETIVGRTCFAPYKEDTNSDDHLRYYPIGRNYKLSCYGLPLEVDSVAFQEQDAEVAACSTTAIWYVLHASPKRLTESEIPSPYDITSKAMHVAFNASNVENGSPHRRFPSPGLDLRQIAEYLRWGRYDSFVVGVVPSRTNINAIIPGGEARLTNDFVLSYLSSSKTPLLIVGTLSTRRSKDEPLVMQGLHAITIMGYSLDPDRDGKRRYQNQQVHWKFERIVNLYIHDDGVGPFAKYRWSNESIQIDETTNNDNLRWYLTNHLENGEPEERRFDPAYIVVPIRDKVRLSHSGIMEFIELACGWIYSSPSHGMEVNDFKRLKSGEWSIELIEVNYLKTKIMTTHTLKGERKSWCKASLPKYLWRAVYSIPPQKNSSEYLPDWEILFDATALTQAIGLIGFLTHDNGDNLNGSMMRLFAQCLNHKSLPLAIEKHPANAHWKQAVNELLATSREV